ncbi:MAG TPA: histidinol dehydrogenase [bacterium]|nr:histidinol dehydrogenase [bacterium]
MRILNYSSAKDQKAIGKLMRREALVSIQGVGSRSALTRKVFGKALSPEQTVDQILKAVREKGDSALFAYTRKLDGFAASRSNVQVSKAEIQKALKAVPLVLMESLRTAITQIRAFHEKEKPRDWVEKGPQVNWWQRWTALDQVGVYVPGGLAVYPSSVLMNVIPAKVAGVPKIVMVTPVKKSGQVDPVILAAAHLAGVDKIFKIGGAQAVAALAYGTKTVPAVDKITGPGNLFVALAKRKVFGQVGIDGFAGPSEVLILSDGTVSPAWVAADILAQAEHDEMASCLLVTTSKKLALEVSKEVELQLELLSRRQVASDSLKSRGAVLLVKTKAQALEAANRFAAEHLEILAQDPNPWFKGLKHAGAVFVGPLSPVAFGDFTAGTNHILPTSGTARFASGLSVYDFMKRTNVLEVKEDGVRKLGRPTVFLAEQEGLTGHAQSVLFRMGAGKKP